MKKILFAIAALAVAFGFTACSNEDEVISNTKDGKTTVLAMTEAGTRTALESDGAGAYDVVWSEGDKIYISDGFSYTEFTLKSGAGKTAATFEGTAPADGEYYAFYGTKYTVFEPTQYYEAGKVSNFPMCASATVTDGKISPLEFWNLGGILSLTVKGTATIKSIKVESEQLMSGPSSFNKLEHTASVSYGNKYLTLDCGDGVALTSEGTVFNIALLANTYTGVKITLTDTDDNTCTKTFKGTGGLVVERSKITKASFTASFVPATPPTDALSGKFSVSDTKKVYFAKGNLYYDGSAFKLEENQYSIATSWNTSHVSNFFWSATAADAYASDCDYEETNGVFFTNASETTPSTSFTVNGQTGVWRTLSASEWGYLFSHYTYKYTSVCGKSGIVIAPAGVTEIDDDPYDKTAWKTAEADGFVFLPNTGYRDDAIYETEKSCLYWSSTLDGYGKPYREFFQWNDGELVTDINIDSPCYWAIGIRLVQDVK